MFKKATLMLLLLMLVAGAASVAVADSPSGQGSQQFGNYTFQYNSSTGAIYNLSYTTDSANLMIANNISVSGQNLSIGNNLEDLQAKNYGNATVLYKEDMNAFVLLTKGNFITNTPPSMVINLTNPASLPKANVSLFLGSSVDNYMNSTAFGSKTFGYQWNTVTVSVTTSNRTYYGLLVSNGVISLSNNNTSVSISVPAGILGAPLVAAFVSHGNLQDQMEKYGREYHFESRLSYNATTGAASGKFVTFDFNKSTGVITNYTSLVNGVKVFNSINASGNGSIGEQSDVPTFSLNQPIVLGSVFFYANNSYVYALHNNPTLQSNFFVENGTMAFNVSSGITMMKFQTQGSSASYSDSQISSNISYQNNATLGLDHEVEAGQTAVYLSGQNFTGFLMVHNGNVAINNTTGTVTVTTNGNHIAKVSFVAPLGLQSGESADLKALNNAIMHQRIAAQLILNPQNGTLTNTSIFYNSSVHMSLVSSTSGKVELSVSSNLHEGANLAIFVSNTVLKNSSKIYVSFDGKSVDLSTVNNTINVTSSTTAYYAVINESNGVLVIIHVPHFSNHTIEISSSPLTVSSSPPLTGNDELYIAIAAIVIIAAIAGVAIKRRK